MTRSLFLFRRDLRVDDNTALNEALRCSDSVIAAFIVDSSLLNKWSDADRRLAFLFQSLKELQTAVETKGGRLLVGVGKPAEIIERWIDEYGFDSLFMNREYTPVGSRRDQHILAVGNKMNVRVHVHDDAVINPPERVRKDDGLPYTVFTPYFRRASQYQIEPPQPLASGKFADVGGHPLEEIGQITKYLKSAPSVFEPGVTGAMRALERLGTLKDYDVLRDVPAAYQTSALSPHLRFGTCSARQVAEKVKSSLDESHPLIRQLYWRDFYVQIAHHFPHVFGSAFRRKYDQIAWLGATNKFELWCEGRTGFPIIDAGMRELQATGNMHNRVRMIVASFLVKNLHIDWRLGEQFFAQHLIDYDPMSNNGNWQWAASTGCDAQPYFRIFNPWRQQQKFDRDCVYIKSWVDELKDFPAKAIHGLEKQPDGYLPQIVDLKTSGEMIKQQFKELGAGAG